MESNQNYMLKWANDYLVSNGYFIAQPPEKVLSTPWSTVVRFSTSRGDIYLKKTPSSMYLSSEPKIIRLLSEKFHASVPVVIAINEDYHCFLMKDAGKPLRDTLKAQFNPALLCDAIKQYAAILRSTEDHIETFLQLGIPDWRLNKLPMLYDQLIKQTDLLKAEGLTDQELQTLQDLSPQFLAQCKLLSSYEIPQTLGYHDFHDKNVLVDSNSKRMTFVDWGETAIIHPFFSLYNCLRQAITHHGVKDGDQTYQNLQDACFENWLNLSTKKQLIEVFTLAKQLWTIYSALACYQFMMGVDLQAYRTYYANRPSSMAGSLRDYIQSWR